MYSNSGGVTLLQNAPKAWLLWAVASPSPPSSLLLLFSSSLSTDPDSWPRTPYPLSFLAAAASSSSCSPGRSFPWPPRPGCTCLGALLPPLSSSGFHVVGRFSFCSFSSHFPSLVRHVLPHLVDAGPCCSRVPRRFSPPPFPPPSEAPDVPIPGRCLPGRSSPGLPPPGCSCPGALLPRMFQSGFRAPASPSPPPSRLSYFSSYLSTFPDSCSCTPFRFLPPPPLLPHGASVGPA